MSLISFLFRFLVLFLAALTAFALYGYVVDPFILRPLCLTDTNGCIRLGYYSYKNSVLIHVRRTGIWVWFNGFRIFVFGQPVGRICENPDKYEAAYAINAETGVKEGYECVQSLQSLIDFYTKNSSMEFVHTRVNDPNTFNVYDVINLMSSKKIINLPSING